MHMIKKRQLVVEEGNEGRTAAEQFYALAASSPPQTGFTAPSWPPEQNMRQNRSDSHGVMGQRSTGVKTYGMLLVQHARTTSNDCF